MHHGHNHAATNTGRMAISATLHCLTGCAIGEIAGLVIGTALGFSDIATIILAVTLAFIFGFGLSTLPLVKSGMRFLQAVPIVIAADAVSIATMEVVDNAVMLIIPGAMGAGLLNPVFWFAMLISLTAAFFAALPVNAYLIKRNKGHTLLMRHHDHNHDHHS